MADFQGIPSFEEYLKMGAPAPNRGFQTHMGATALGGPLPQTAPFTPTPDPGNPALGPNNMAAMLGMGAKAIAPVRYDAKGNIIKGFGERMGEMVTQMAQAQIMAKALAAGGGQINPMSYMSMFGNTGGKP